MGRPINVFNFRKFILYKTKTGSNNGSSDVTDWEYTDPI